MDEANFFGAVFTFTALLVLVALIVKLAFFGCAFSKDTQYICHRMDRADSYEEYRRWRGELRCHYLCLLPFVNEKNVMFLYDRIFHRDDRAEMKERKDSLVPLLLPSGIGICLCLVCLCSMTWAWFAVSYETPTQKLTSAWYEVSVTDVICDAAPFQLTKDGPYNFEAGATYTIVLHADGSVKECGGYCLIESEGAKEQYTQTIKPGDTIRIRLTPEVSGVYTFTGVWGSIPSTVAKDEIIKAIAEDNGQSATEETTADPSETTAAETTVVDTIEVDTTEVETVADTVITELETTPPETTAPAETDPIPVESIDPIPPDTSEAEPVSEEAEEGSSEEDSREELA